MSTNRRQELYDQIRQSSKEEVILNEMIRLGFWKEGDGQTSVSEEWVRKKGELTRELNELVQRQRKYADKEAMLKEVRAQRMKEAKARREETKQRREQQRQEKAARWREAKETDLVYLGENVSGGLSSKDSELEKLAAWNLPQLQTVTDLASAMAVPIGQLRFLAFHREVGKLTHYRRFYLKKKSGGQRLISAPMPRLKSAQHWILENILVKVPVHDAAHGFVRERSIVSNAQHHVGKEVVINMDLRDFFPSIIYPRVKGVFRKLGYSEQLATVLGLICTEPEMDELELDGETYYVATSERHLPQGAPTSPAVTNLLCYRLDKRLTGMAQSLGFTYSRYADDLTFSASGEPAKNGVKKLLWRTRSILESEGLVLHPDKLRIMRKGQRQEVTGITVNEKLSVPRKEMKRFRALLHHLEKDGLQGKHWRGAGTHLLAAVRGYANFMRMVDPERAAPYVEKVDKLLVKHGWKHEIRHPAKGTAGPPVITRAGDKKVPWWKRIFGGA